MTESDPLQSAIDQEHLRLLSIGYIISGAMSAFFSLFALIYVFMGVMMSTMFASAAKTSPHPEQMPPAFIGWIFAIFGGLFFSFLVLLALAKFRTAACIRRRKSKTFCMVVAAISCLGIPYGTCLGVGTFLILSRKSVADLFNSPDAA